MSVMVLHYIFKPVNICFSLIHYQTMLNLKVPFTTIVPCEASVDQNQAARNVAGCGSEFF